MTNCLKCLDALFIIPSGDDSMQQLSTAVECKALGWVAARLVVNAKILKHTMSQMSSINVTSSLYR